MPRREPQHWIGAVRADLQLLEKSPEGTGERRAILMRMRDNVSSALAAEWINLGHDEAKAEAKSKKSKRAKKGTR